MTFQQHFLAWLQENGLSPAAAQTVIERALVHSMFDSMADRWDDSVEGYPSVLLATLTISMKAVVVEWMEAEKPQHWAKTLFTS